MGMPSEQILASLKQHANAQNVEGMARFGSRPAQVLGIAIPTLRRIAKDAIRELQAGSKVQLLSQDS